jgi:hypothetical protein
MPLSLKSSFVCGNGGGRGVAGAWSWVRYWMVSRNAPNGSFVR